MARRATGSLCGKSDIGALLSAVKFGFLTFARGPKTKQISKAFSSPVSSSAFSSFAS